jgi:nitrogen regulatory protein PII
VESVVPSDIADSVVEAIVATARTGNVGDGRVFVYDVQQSIRIRTGEDGEDSVRHEEPVGWGH